MGSLNFHFLLLLILINTKREVSADCLFNIIYDRYFNPETAPRLAKVVIPRNPEKNEEDFVPKECPEEIKLEPPEISTPVTIVDTLDIEKNIFEINQRENRTNLVQLLGSITSVVTEIPKLLSIMAVIFLVIAIIFYYMLKKNPCTFSTDDTEQSLDIPSQVQSKSAIVNEIKQSGNEDAEKYLTNDFLEVMSNYANELKNAEEQDYSRYLTPEDLLQMGKYYYHQCQSQYSRENQEELKTNVILNVKRSGSTQAYG